MSAAILWPEYWPAVWPINRKIQCLIDVGTNGEIVIGNNEWLVCCSASAGPAFEGGGAKSGMRATKGAIEKNRDT